MQERFSRFLLQDYIFKHYIIISMISDGYWYNLFFSNRKYCKIGHAISYKLKDMGMSVCLIDITPFRNRKEKINNEKYDALIFGFPVWGSIIQQFVEIG